MNILFLSIGRLENINDRGIYTDLLRELKSRGHNLYVCCGRQRREKKPTECVTEDGVTFVRTKTGNLTMSNIIEKGIATLMVTGQFISSIKKYLSNVKFDLVIYSTPPITLEGVVEYVKKRDGAKTYLLLKDIFPQNAVDIGLMSKKSPVYKYFRAKEKKFYGVSDYIGCMSPANIRYLLEHNPEISPERVEECPNSIEPVNKNRTSEEKLALRKKFGIPQDRLALVFGGNLGKMQSIPFFTEVMRSNKSNDRVHFVISGKGSDEKYINEYIENEHPANVTKFGMLPKDDYESVAACCDVGIIIIDRRSTIPNFPSRLLSYLEESIPVIAATDKICDAGVIAENGGFGVFCESGSVKAFNDAVESLYDEEKRNEMGRKGYEYLLEHYTVKSAADIILKHFR